MPRQRFSDPIRYLGDFHDFMRALYHLRSGLTKYAFAKLMSVDDSAAMARLEGWVKAGVVERREDGKYYLISGKIIIPEFGKIEVEDHTINISIDPRSKFVQKAKYGLQQVFVQTDTSPKSDNF